MATNYVFNDVDQLINYLRKIQKEHPERVFVTGIIGGGTISAPTRKCKAYKHKIDVLYSPDLFHEKGIEPIIRGGGIYIGHMEKRYFDLTEPDD